MINVPNSKTIWSLNEQGYVKVPGGRIWYGVSGDREAGETPLLAVHGGPGMSHDYLYPLVDLADDRAVIFYDQLDAGKSDRPNDPANWVVSRFADEIDAVRDTLDLSGVNIFGNSWGGTVAAAYAATRPEGLERLILSSPLISTRRWVIDNSVYRNDLPDDVLAVMERCEASGETNSEAYESAVNVFYRRHLCRLDHWPDYVTDTFETLNDTCYAGMWGPNEFTCNGTLSDYDGTDGLASINVPTLMTCGEFDEAVPTSCREYANMIPEVTFVEFKNTSHMAFVEDRINYIATVRRFLVT